ncbi:MAG: BadF/BadG/BcrA/BcrD ATPase family protein [Lachnospiraceae bacterium]|nr:BadF/BadG/BcrA/BcrD ATPase family protein [Lachnospiraceae bacterium]
MADRIYISVDGGGTKTEFCIYNESTGSYSLAFYKGSNYKNVDKSEDRMDIAQQFLKTLEAEKIDLNDISGVVFGISGIDSEKDLEYYRNLISTTGLDMDKVIICNDCQYSLRGMVDGDGMAVVCGTGAIVYGISNGEIYRTAGWGMPYSDLGSGTWIGAEAIKEAIQLLDEGMNEDSPIVTLMSRFKTEGVPLQWVINELDVPTTASLAFDVIKLAEAGEPTAQEIILEAAFHIAGYIRTTFSKMKFRGDTLKIVYVGGVNKSGYFRNLLEPIVQKMLGTVRIEWILPKESAARNGIEYIIREMNRKQG